MSKERINKLDKLVFEEKLQLINNKGEYNQFLKTIGYLNRFSFDNTVAIFVQKPGTKFVAGYKAWNEYDRYVKRGSKSIRLYNSNRDNVACVFALEDTHSFYGEEFKAWDIATDKLFYILSKEYNVSNSENIIYSSVKNYLNRNKDIIAGELAEYNLYNASVDNFLIESVTEAVSYRLGYSYEYKHSYLEKLTPSTLSIIGRIVIQATNKMINKIQDLDIEITGEFVYNHNTTITSNGLEVERSDTYGERDRDKLCEGRGLLISGFGGGNSRDSDVGEIWTNEKRVHAREGRPSLHGFNEGVLSTFEADRGTSRGASQEYNGEQDKGSGKLERDNSGIERQSTISMGSDNATIGAGDNITSDERSDLFGYTSISIEDNTDEIIEYKEKADDESAFFVEVSFSEHDEIEEKRYELLEFENLVKRISHEWFIGREKQIEKYGSLDAAMEKKDYAYVGYAKTYIKVNIPGMGYIDDRIDIGDYDDGLCGYLAHYSDYEEAVEVLRNAVAVEEQLRYENEIDAVIAGTFPFYSSVKVGETSELMVEVGCEKLPVLITQVHIKKAIKVKNDRKHTHELTVEQIKKLPQLLKEPVMIFDSPSRSDSIVMVTDEMDQDDNPVIISIKPNGKGKYEVDEIESNFVTSVYGKDNFISYITNVIEKDDILYINDKKNQDMFKRWGLQSPELINNLDYNVIIHKSNNIVNKTDEFIVNDIAEDKSLDKISENTFEQLSLFDIAPSEAEQIGDIVTNNVNNNTIFSNTLIPDELVKDIVASGANYEARYAVYYRIIRPFDSREKMVDFIKKQYVGSMKGFILSNGDKIAVYADEIGLKITHGIRARHKWERLVTYEEILDIANELIVNGKYLNSIEANYASDMELRYLSETVAYIYWDSKTSTYFPKALGKRGAFPEFRNTIMEIIKNKDDKLTLLTDSLRQIYDDAQNNISLPRYIKNNHYNGRYGNVFDRIELFDSKPIEHLLKDDIEVLQESFITHDFIDSHVTHSGFSEGNFRIFKHFKEDFVSINDAAQFLSKEFGTGGAGVPGGNGYDLWHQPGKGYKLSKGMTGDRLEIKLKWTDVAKINKYLVDNNIFFDSKEKLEEYNEWRNELESKVIDNEEEDYEETLDNNEKEIVSAAENIRNFHYNKDNYVKRETFAPRSRFRENIEAITLLKKLEKENRNATLEEMSILSKYVGWGGLQEAFDVSNEKWSNEYEELKELLSDDEYKAARESVLTSFYTDIEVINAMYKALNKMNFTAGRILEPCCGVGNFFGCLPEELNDTVKLHGVELDSLSGRIAKKLYPEAEIQIAPYEKSDTLDNYYDVAIGNVPFGDFKVYDNKEKKWNFSIHNYFFANTIKKVKEGGIIAFITSSATMDAKNPEFRKYIAERAEFLGAIRLPNTAFKGIAGTRVVSDIIFLKKRSEPTVNIENEMFLYVGNHQGHAINEYFIENPQMVCGELKEVSGPYGPELTCSDNGTELSVQLDGAIEYLKEYSIKTEPVNSIERNITASELPANPDIENLTYGIIDGKIYYRNNSIMTEVKDLNEKSYKRLEGLLGIRDCLNELISLQLMIPDDEINEQIEITRNNLNTLYDDFVKKYGYINDKANVKLFDQDSNKYKMLSLERGIEDSKEYQKADIFIKRTVKPVVEITSCDTPVDALAVSLIQKGYVDVEYISQLCDLSVDECLEALVDMIYLEPETEKYVSADEYLSGDIAEKLILAKNKAEEDKRFEKNITALEKCMPERIEAKDISVRLGSSWIPKDMYKEFIFSLLSTPGYINIDVAYIQNGSEYFITNKSHDNKRVQVTQTYGTDRKNAYEIIEDSLNLRDTKVYDYYDDEDGNRKSVLNVEKTVQAQAKQDVIKEKFVEWLWSDPTRLATIENLYNERFNTIRNREFDGSFLTLPGSNPAIKLKEHQLNAVARIVYGGNTLLAHVVGAGKTFEMIAAAMESKRLGLCNKPLFVVPKHLTVQWATEFMTLYPTANILVAKENDFTPENRKKFCTKIAMGEYDAIIIGHSQFEKIPMSMHAQEDFIKDQLLSIEKEILSVQESRSNRYRTLTADEKITIKKLESAKKKLETKLKALTDMDKKDNAITFEELGVDRLYVDEAHYYKNLYTRTKMRNIAGIPTSESQKSMDMYMKCQYINKMTNEKGIVFATGTPISNSMVEMYTLQRYLAPNALKKRGIEEFDAWASTFGNTTTAMELAPEGTGYRMKTRFSKFFNLPELVTMFKEFADIKTADMLQLDVPVAEYHNVTIESNDFQKEMLLTLADRADKVRQGLVQPSDDNMLKITTDGRKLALDQRILSPFMEEGEESKSKSVVNEAMKLYRQYNDDKAVQVIFCDMSTPTAASASKKKDNVIEGIEFDNIYEDIKRKLITAGVPEKEIAFIHNANTDKQKDELFAKCRSGEVRFLLGSTFKLGAGTNIQNRLIGLHHVDVPWRPSDIEQQEGRIIRQGNRYKNVHIFRYVTEGTFDAYSWQIIENKQKFISQIMTSKAPVRVADDVDETALSYAEVKALASGNPLIKERMDIEQRLSKLTMMKTSYNSNRLNLKKKIDFSIPEQIGRSADIIEKLEKDLIKTQGMFEVKEFPGITIGKTYYEDIDKAGEVLINTCLGNKNDGVEFTIGEYRGFKLNCVYSVFKTYTTGELPYELKLVGATKHSLDLGRSETGNFLRLDNALKRIPEKLENHRKNLELLNQDLEVAKSEYEKPFKHEDELMEKKQRLRELDEILDLSSNEEEREAHTSKNKILI